MNNAKKIHENNRMGQTKDLFKKIGDIQEHFMQGWDGHDKRQKW